MKRVFSFLLAIALTFTLAAPAFAAPPPKTGNGAANGAADSAANGAKAEAVKTWITFNENGITISRGITIYLPYQVSKINPTITIVNIDGVICLKFFDSTETLRLISLGKVEDLVFNGRFPALTIDESIEKLNVTFGENASIGKLTINGVAKVNIHEKMSVAEVLVNGAATVNFAKDAKIGKAIVTSPKAKINVPEGATFKVIYAFVVGASARPSRGSMNSGTVVSPPTQDNPPVDPVEPPVDPVEPEPPALPAVTVSTQAQVEELKKDGTYKEITITGNESLNLTGIAAKKVTVKEGTATPPPTNAIMAASARGASERSFTRSLMFSGERIEEIDCQARAEIMSSSPFPNFTGNKEGIIVNAPVELLTVNAPLEVKRDVTTINAFSDFAILGTGLVDSIDVKSPITISGSAAVKAITTAVDLNLKDVKAETVTTTGKDSVRVSFQSSRIGNLIASSTATTTITPGTGTFIETATANGNLTIEPFGTTENAGNRVKTVIVPATEKAITVTVNQEIYQLLTAKSLTIAGKSPVNNVIVTGDKAVTLTVSNTAKTPVISAPEGAKLTNKEGTEIIPTVQYPAPKLTLTDANGNVLTDYTSSSLGNIVINAKSNTDIIYVKPGNVLPDAEGSDKYQCAESAKNLADYKVGGVVVSGKGFKIEGSGSSTKDVKYGYFKTVKGDGSDQKAASQIVSVTVNFPSPTKHVVTFDTNGGSPIAPMLVKKGAEIGRNEIDERSPTKAGASFDGWYKDKECTKAWKYSSYPGGEPADTVTSDITLYAKWNDTDTTRPTASFDPIDGEKDVAVNKSISIFFDEPIVITEDIKEAVRLKNGTTVVAAAVTLSPDTKQIVIKPTAKLENATDYTVEIDPSKIKDAANNAATPASVKFTTFNPKSTTPTVTGNATVDKKTVAAAAVTATLSNESLFNITATWKVYKEATGVELAADITASCVGDQLTLTHATDITAGIYYVAVTEKDKDGKVKTESDRLKLTVREKSRTPTTDNPTAIKDTANDKAVEFTLSNTEEFGTDAVWEVFRDGGITPDYVTIAVNGKTLTLTYSGSDKLPARMFWVTVTEKGKAPSDGLDLWVAEKAGNGIGKANVPVAETLLTLSDLKVNGALIEGFNAEAFDYSVNLPAGTVEVPLVTATGLDPHAKVEILGAKDLNTATTVTVSANNGTKLVYTINFVVAAPTPEEIAAKAAEEKAAAEKLAADEAAAKLAADEKAAKDAAAKAAEEAAKPAAEAAAKPAAEKPAEENPTADPSANPSATAPTTPAN